MLLGCDATLPPCSLEYYSVHRFRVEIAMKLQMFRPYGARNVVCCS